MRLDFVEYCQDKDLPSEWRLDGCQLGNVNLIVGKNASGKSRILRSIKFLSDFLSGEEKLSRLDGRLREWKLTFDSHNEDNKKVYILKVENSLVIEESYTIGSKFYLKRDKSGEGKIWAKQLEKETPSSQPNHQAVNTINTSGPDPQESKEVIDLF